ncbi:hypothetical protein G6F40_016809 [Rhizopus arrhizus]|nr:hypothetical protein G6F40_016809 [Rhizopus arrhizus]
MAFSAALLQLGQATTRLRPGGAGQAGQCRHLQAEAAVGRAVLHRVHEHQRFAVLDRIQVHVGDAAAAAFVLLVGQRGQLEVVGGEQRQRAVVRQQTAGDGPRQRQAVACWPTGWRPPRSFPS